MKRNQRNQRNQLKYVVTDLAGMPTGVNDVTEIETTGRTLAVDLVINADNGQKVAELVDQTLDRVGAIAFQMSLHAALITTVELIDDMLDQLDNVPGLRGIREGIIAGLRDNRP